MNVTKRMMKELTTLVDNTNENIITKKECYYELLGIKEDFEVMFYNCYKTEKQNEELKHFYELLEFYIEWYDVNRNEDETEEMNEETLKNLDNYTEK